MYSVAVPHGTMSDALVVVQPHVYRMTCWLATCGLRSDVVFRGPFSDLN